MADAETRNGKTREHWTRHGIQLSTVRIRCSGIGIAEMWNWTKYGMWAVLREKSSQQSDDTNDGIPRADDGDEPAESPLTAVAPLQPKTYFAGSRHCSASCGVDTPDGRIAMELCEHQCLCASFVDKVHWHVCFRCVEEEPAVGVLLLRLFGSLVFPYYWQCDLNKFETSKH